VVAARSLSSCDAEGTSTARVQHFQVGGRASATRLERDDRLDHPSIFFDDELATSRDIGLVAAARGFLGKLRPCRRSNIRIP